MQHQGVKMLVSTIEQALAEVVDRHRVLYEERTIDARLKAIIRAGGHTNVTEDDVRHILRKSRSVFFDTHVEVVSGHHTATYLRFESIARFPELIRQLTDDMADWIRKTFQHHLLGGDCNVHDSLHVAAPYKAGISFHDNKGFFALHRGQCAGSHCGISRSVV